MRKYSYLVLSLQKMSLLNTTLILIKSTLKFVSKILKLFIDNIHVTFGDQIFQESLGFPMDTNCAPSLQSLKHSTFPLERWANGERTANKREANCVWTLNATCIVNGERTGREWMLNARWTIYSECLECFS